MYSLRFLGQCEGPIWQVDDISQCFQHVYLETIFPLIAVSTSILILLSISFKHSIHIGTESKSREIRSSESTLNSDTYESQNCSSSTSTNVNDEILEGLANTHANIILGKTTDKGHVTAIDVPRGQRRALALEIIAVLVINILNITELFTKSSRPTFLSVKVVGIITWTYIAMIVFIRFALYMSNRRISTLWNHSMLLYVTMWALSLTVFRSAIIHPRHRVAQAVLIAKFLFITLLFLNAITTRKGNRNVLLEWENDLEPSREALASLLSIATFSWADAIVWKGYHTTYEMSRVWNLVPKDKAATILADYRQLKKTTALSWHLLRYFKKLLLIQCTFAVISGIFTFAPTLLLKSILEYIEDPSSSPRNVIWLFVILLAFTDILRSFADGQALWVGRKICIRLRAIIIGDLYAKALRRKAASSSDTALGNIKREKNSTVPSFIKKLLKLDRKLNNSNSERLINATTDVVIKSKDEQTNVGTIINLMSVDSFKVSEITAYLHYLFAAAPTQLVLAVYLLYQILGYSSIPGIFVMVILLPINIILARGFGRYQKRIMNATDKRIHTTNELLQNIRIIKYFAWEQKFGQIVDEKRSIELSVLKSKFVLWAFAVAIWNTVPIAITFFSFLVYTLVEGKPLYPSIAFTAISLFNILRVPLDQLGDMIAHVLESKVSVDRIEEFLNEEETDKYNQLRHENLDEGGNEMIGFKKTTLSWGVKKENEPESASGFCLNDLNIKFEIGKLNIIAGTTGSGKTSLLMALLGEMTLIQGMVFLPGGFSREDIRTNPETGLKESVAYCAQQPWLTNSNIKDNILFAAPYDKKRYNDVIFACALERDFQILNDGDQTLVGEKGITLSGGQKQRISLARVLYSNSRHVLMDDCLSAVDPHTAKWIFENCIRGPLMEGRTCVLVTHNLALCLSHAHYVVVLENGNVQAQGKPHEVIASGVLGDEIGRSKSGSPETSSPPSRTPSTLKVVCDNINSNDKYCAKTPNPVDQKLDAMVETKAEGGVKLSVILLYLKSMGPWWFWIIAVMIFGVQQFGALAANAWIRKWANQYSTGIINSFYTQNFISVKSSTMLNSQKYGFHVTPPFPNFDFEQKRILSNGIQEVNVPYYLAVYAVIGISCMLVALFRDLWLFYGSLTASWQIYQRLMNSIFRAKFKFFDITPLGQLMNRFSKDLEAIDQEVAPVSIGIISCGLAILVTVALITFITPGFLIAVLLISFMYFYVSKFYLRSSRDLKRLESIQRSPLFQHFGETITGITTIRAFGDEKRFTRDNLLKINSHNRPFIYLWATNRWLAFRMDLIGDFVAFAAGAFVVLSIGKIDAGSAGLSLSYAISFTENMLWLIRLYAINEQNMNSVERLKEYIDVESEAKAVIEETKPAPEWPSQGSVEFINYTTRYRTDLDPVLKNVSFKIQAGEKVGVVGRTGAGKSSLALALFRGLEAEEGKILIDGVDIGLIGLQDLRESITIVPQDPTLFTGTIRTNLDPFDQFSDEEIFVILRRVQLIADEELTSKPLTPTNPVPLSVSESKKTTSNNHTKLNSDSSEPLMKKVNKNVFLDLSSPVSESGSNLSQGQRQLLCLARALLKDPKVLMMDEATASIDYLTDSRIQRTIRELKSTIITIAHRLQTIMDYDKVIVLDNGRVLEFGHPWVLLRDKRSSSEYSVSSNLNAENSNVIRTGLFRDMCETTGDIEELEKIAKRAWNSSRLLYDE